MQPFQEKRAVVDGFEQSVQCIFRHLTNESRTECVPHYHDYLEFLYGISGEARVLIGDRWYTMREGDFFAVNARQIHDVVCQGAHADYFVIKFLPDILYRGEQNAEELPYLLLLWQKNLMVTEPIGEDTRADAETEGLLGQIMKEWTERSFGYGLVIRACLVRIMVHRWRQADPRGEDILSRIPTALARPMARVLEGAQKHFATWTVADAARAANISYSYFSRVFCRIFGTSFSAYLEDLRLSESAVMLLSEDMAISAVAEAVGFHSASYFIDRFRRKYGLSPGAYRRAVAGTGEQEAAKVAQTDVQPTDALVAEDPFPSASEQVQTPYTEGQAYTDTYTEAVSDTFRYTVNPTAYEDDPCCF